MTNRFLFAILISLLACWPALAQNSASIARSEVEEFADTLVSAKSAGQREQLLESRKSLLTPDLSKALISQGNTHLLAGRYSLAFDIYGLARNIAQSIGDKEGVASASLDIGTVYYFQANYPAAIEHYRKARELFTEVTNNYESAKALSGLALIYKEQRRDDEALSALQQVLREFTALGNKEEVANTLSSIGTIYYGQGNYVAAADNFIRSNEANSNPDNIIRLADSLYMQGDYSQALTYYKQSLEANAKKNDVGVTISSLNGAANSSYYQGNYEEALKYYQQNVALQEARYDRLGVVASLRGIGNAHRSLGNYGAALESYFKSLAISEQLKVPTGTILGSIGLVRALQGDYERALESYRRAMTEFETNSNNIELARVLSLTGNVYYAQGNYQSAIDTYRRAFPLREQMDDRQGQGDLLSGIGSALLKQGKYDDGLDSYQKALSLFDEVKNRERMADVLTRVAEAFLSHNEFSKALSAAESAGSLAREIDNLEVRWFSLMLAGKAHRGMDHVSQARQSFADAISIVESLRERPASIAGDNHNSSLAYLAAADESIAEHRVGEAFDYVERAKIQGLSELLKTGNGRTTKDLSPAEVLEEQHRTGELSSLELQLDRESQSRTSTEARRKYLRDHLVQARTDYAALRQKLFVAHPQLKADRGELEPLKLREMQSLLGDSKTALLEYAISETNVYLYVLTFEEASARASTKKKPLTLVLKAYPLEMSGADLVSRVRQFEQALSSRSENFEETSRNLYDLLLRPAGDQLVLKSSLVIVPDGILWRLPFEALQSAEGHYVLDQMQVSYAPSFAALREMRKRRLTSKPLNSTFVALANPELSSNFKNLMALAYPGKNLDSSQLQEVEVNGLTSNRSSRRYVGADANEEKVRQEAETAHVLHFATPALLDDVSPMSSFIGLSRGRKIEDRGFLQTREIMNLRTSAQLVVLSDSQSNGNFAGLASAGLAWAWFVAGSPATVVSRWELPPEAKSKLMAQFYSGWNNSLGRPTSRANALRQGALFLRHSNEYQHPYYWASFALIGDGR